MRKKVSIFLCFLYVVFMAVVAVQLFLKDNNSDALIALGGVACGLIPLLIILFILFIFPQLLLQYELFIFLFLPQKSYF